MKLLFVILQMILLTSCAVEPGSSTDLAPQSESSSVSVTQDSHSYTESNSSQDTDSDSVESNQVQSNVETSTDVSNSIDKEESLPGSDMPTSMVNSNSMSASNSSTTDADSSTVDSSESSPQELADSTATNSVNETYIYDNIVKFHDVTINLMDNVGNLQLIPDGDVLHYNMGAGDFDSIRYSYEEESFSLGIINDTGFPRKYSECKINKFETSGKAVLAGNIQVGTSNYSQVVEKYGKPSQIDGHVAMWKYSTGSMELTFNQGILSSVCINVK